MSRAVIVLLSCLALAQCAPTSSGDPAQQRADAATVAACRQRANQAYERQYRAEVYSPQNGVNAPFSGNYDPSGQIRGLSQQFGHDTMVSDCIRDTGTGADRDAAAPPPNGSSGANGSSGKN